MCSSSVRCDVPWPFSKYETHVYFHYKQATSGCGGMKIYRDDVGLVSFLRVRLVAGNYSLSCGGHGWNRSGRVGLLKVEVD